MISGHLAVGVAALCVACLLAWLACRVTIQVARVGLFVVSLAAVLLAGWIASTPANAPGDTAVAARGIGASIDATIRGAKRAAALLASFDDLGDATGTQGDVAGGDTAGARD